MTETNPDDLDGKPVDDEIIIEQEAGDTGKPAVEEESADDLKAQLAEIRRKAEENERLLAAERAERAREKQSAAVELTDTRLQTITNALSATDGEIKAAQARRRAALEAGDWEAEAKANDELVDLRLQRHDLSTGKTAIEQQIEDAKRAPSDPVERYISQANLAPNSAAWIRSHPETITDVRKNARLVAAHWDAVDAGFSEGSPEYFSLIEKQMGYASPQRQEEPRREAEPIERRQAAPAAPVSRDVPNGNGQARTTRVTLTAQEREAADMAKMSYADYASERDKLRAAGAFLTQH